MTIEAVILQVDHFIYNCSGNRNSSTGKGGGRINVTDEIEVCRQKQAFLTLKRRRDSGSSPKTGIFHLKTATRFRF
ncbi:hypothetical protein LIZ76_11140, partial [Caldibacillus sp. 210928-DFI.2.22]|uniref:hypothetical protein n=1 Tax=unclassified Caldibacillus TaxID=2641266 RepID=UPI001D089F00